MELNQHPDFFFEVLSQWRKIFEEKPSKCYLEDENENFSTAISLI